MKRILSFVLASCLVFGLTSCAPQQKPEVSVGDIPGKVEFVYPEPEELLSGNYGVDDLQSFTLGVLVEMDIPGYNGSYAGTYQQDGHWLYLALDEVSESVDDVGEYISIYYDIRDETMYYKDAEGVVHGKVEPDLALGFNVLDSIEATKLVRNPEMSIDASTEPVEVNGEWVLEDTEVVILGSTDAALIDELVSALGVVSQELPADVIVDTKFTYELPSGLLSGMRWDIEGSGYKLVIDAEVSAINETVITIPYKEEEVQYEGRAVDEIWNSVDGVREGEVSLSKEFFGVDYVQEFDFLMAIDEEYRDLEPDILYLVRYFYNSYSREGFQRMLLETVPTVEYEGFSAVLVCELAGIPWESLYAGKFMTESDVSNYRSDLYHHIFGSDALEVDPNA